jgi:hypothetical protein
VLVAVVAVLALSYARSLTLYFNQEREIHETEAANDARRAAIVALEDEVARWSDPDYVRAQARERLGWVMPGEVGYRVIAHDGTILGADAAPVAEVAEADAGPWYEQFWSSVKSADLPTDATADVGPTRAPPTTIVAPADEPVG